MTDLETIELACRRTASATGSPEMQNLADQIAKILRERNQAAAVPTDLAENHDHYLYGSPKR